MNKEKIIILLLGHGKSGTRWLSKNLHDTNAFNFFFRLDSSFTRPASLNRQSINNELFEKIKKSNNKPIFIDALIISQQDVILKIKKELKNFKIIPVIIYREIIDVLISYYNYTYSNPDTAVLRDSNFIKKNYKMPLNKSLLKGGYLNEIYKVNYNYVNHAKFIRKHFDDFLEFDYDEVFKGAREETLEKILNKAKVKKSHKFQKTMKTYNKTYIPKSRIIDKILWKTIYEFTGVPTTYMKQMYNDHMMAPSLTKFIMDLNKSNKKIYLNSNERKKIKLFYKNEVDELRKVTKLKLASWS